MFVLQIWKIFLGLIREMHNWIQLFIYFSEKPTKHGKENNSMSNTMGSKPAVITSEGSQKSQQNSANSQQRREDIRLTKMMLIIFVSFIVSLYYMLSHWCCIFLKFLYTKEWYNIETYRLFRSVFYQTWSST